MTGPDSIPRKRKPWVLTFFSLITIAGLIATPFLTEGLDGEKLPDIVRFFGHFHPALLHLPIGVFSLILIQEIGTIFGKQRDENKSNSLFPLFFGAVSAVVAVIAGFMLYHGLSGDYANNEIAARHLWGGLIFAIAAILTYIIKAWTVSISGNLAFYRLFLFSSVAVMAFASHDGATLTHGEDYLTKYAPQSIRKILGLHQTTPVRPTVPTTSSASPIVYTDIIAPILERRCVQCHKEGKAKGKLRMDTFEMLVIGGKDGPAIEAGSSAKSLIIQRIELPMDDEDHMPPEGKPDIEEHEVAIIKWWIDSGADPKKTLADYEIPAAITASISKLPATASIEKPSPASNSPTPDANLQATVAELSKVFPSALTFESQHSSSLEFTAAALREKFSDADLVKLEKIFPHLITLDLTATKVTDKSSSLIATAEQLRMIRLSETEVSDAIIDDLLKLTKLESLNLYGTKVTDAGISKLAAMSQLKRLYLWQTAVTPEAIKSLKEMLPDLEIVTGS
ncbi:MAG: hypothetical protein H8M99_12205 [Gloeobacteraceae cyanobacterium ES-bin-144]|nr:hypothetical protein [Verrucomicrobiales bacterium]